MPDRKGRGRATQGIAARWFQRHGWAYATPVTGAVTGRDILNMPAMAPEIKATADNPGPAGLRQAARHAGNSGDLPFVVWRPNGYGETDLPDWPVLLTLHHFTELSRGAGFGDPLPPEWTCGNCGAITRARMI